MIALDLFEEIYQYLNTDAEIALIASTSVIHPDVKTQLNKGVITVALGSNTSEGRYQSGNPQNIELAITLYHTDFTKMHKSFYPLVKSKMDKYPCSLKIKGNYQLVKVLYPIWLNTISMHMGQLIYCFYLSEN